MDETEVRKFDCIIIGAGQAGVPLAKAYADAGKNVALVERLHVGGTCVNEGCTPTKTMIASGEVEYLAKRGHEFGVITGHVRSDMQKIRQRKRDIVESFVTASVGDLTSRPNLSLIFGHAHFTGPKEVEVLTSDGTFEQLAAETIVINTGARPHMPAIRGLDTLNAFDSTTIMEIDQAPEHLIILGGGYIGVEFAQLFRRLGSRVTVVERAAQLLGHEDRDVAKAVVELLREDGIRVLLGSEAILCEKGAESIRITINSQGVELPIEGSHVLVALGRLPNTDGLDLDAAGVKANDHGSVEVDDKLQTSVPGIYAAGDMVAGELQFTHVSYDDYRILKTNLLDGGSATHVGRLIPYAVFIDPQLGRVGLSEEQAKAKGLEVKIARMEMSSVARALESDRSRGFMKAVIDAKSGLILGFTCLGFNGGEIMGMVQIAMMGKVPYTTLRDAIFAHPTLAEALNNLFATVD